MTEKALVLHKSSLLKLPIVYNNFKVVPMIPFFRQYSGTHTIVYVDTESLIPALKELGYSLCVDEDEANKSEYTPIVCTDDCFELLEDCLIIPLCNLYCDLINNESVINLGNIIPDYRCDCYNRSACTFMDVALKYPSYCFRDAYEYFYIHCAPKDPSKNKLIYADVSYFDISYSEDRFSNANAHFLKPETIQLFLW